MGTVTTVTTDTTDTIATIVTIVTIVTIRIITGASVSLTTSTTVGIAVAEGLEIAPGSAGRMECAAASTTETGMDVTRLVTTAAAVVITAAYQRRVTITGRSSASCFKFFSMIDRTRMQGRSRAMLGKNLRNTPAVRILT